LPTAAQAAVSDVIGRDSSAYWVRQVGSGLTAGNAAERLQVRFARSEVLIRSGRSEVGLGLRTIGLGSSSGAVGPARRSWRANRVVYTHPNVVEWYSNGPAGIEQGFTVFRPPSARRAGPLTLSLTLSHGAVAALGARGRSIMIGLAGARKLRYGGLTATDAQSRALNSWLEVAPGRLLLRVDVDAARYPVRIDPFVQQAQLTPGDAVGAVNAGFSAALSSNGNTALIGGPEDNGGVGAAWVFTRAGSTWIQQGSKLTGAGEVGVGAFGASVALSVDGRTALVGGPGDNLGIGAAWVFMRDGSAWRDQGSKLTGLGETSGEPQYSWGAAAENIRCRRYPGFCGGAFGASVALSAEGSTALIGAPGDREYLGAAWVFVHARGAWIQQGEKLSGRGEEPIDQRCRQFTRGACEKPVAFGAAVALSALGNTALVGGPGDSYEGGSEGAHGPHGAAWIFVRSGSTWTEQGEKLIGPANLDGAISGARLGTGVALSGDGDTALIGAPDSYLPPVVVIYSRSGSSWTLQGETLKSRREWNDEGFGRSVAVSSTGHTALVDSYEGAWMFVRAGTTWTRQEQELPCSSTCEAVALSPDGSTALLGGFVFVNEPVPTVSALAPASGGASGATSVTITGSGFTGATSVRFGAKPAISFTVDSDTLITATSPSGAGTTDVTVTTAEGKSTVWWADRFTYLPLAITGLSPASGTEAGGTKVTITGSNFLGATAVKFDELNATSFTVESESSITATTPPQTGGYFRYVTVITPEETSGEPSLASRFSYEPPRVTTIDPGAGPSAGGARVTISGSYFAAITGVKFGERSAPSYTVNSESSITAVTPPGAGQVRVIVEADGAGRPTFWRSNEFNYAYLYPPNVTGVSPAGGPAAGETRVQIIGGNFTEPMTVSFGGRSATSVIVESSTRLTAVSPPGTTGVAPVVVSTAGGPGKRGSFRYWPPTITEVSPRAGPAAGGTHVNVTGSGFAPGIGTTGFRFGATRATSVSCSSTSSCSVVSPAHARANVDVIAIEGRERSARTPADRFSYG
jgi:hypothetical protein